MSEERVVYSIQKTYIIKPVSKSEKRILTCDQRIDIPTIETLSNVELISPDNNIPLTVIPCIELAGEFLSEFDFTFETNEGLTVLPIKIYPIQYYPLGSPYNQFRYVLALPIGATGVKSCKLIHKSTGEEFQHNFTFGIMPPPYNYDNALFGYLSTATFINSVNILKLNSKVSTAFSNARKGLYIMEFNNISFPFTSNFTAEDRNLSVIKFRVTNKTGVKASLELEFTYRDSGDSKGNDMFALPIADGDNSVIIDIDKGIIITVADSTAAPFMLSIPAKHTDYAITALNKASISGDTTSQSIDLNYYFKQSLLPVG